MNESEYKLRLVKEINAISGAYACRVEDKYRPGVLDLFIKVPRFGAIWAEAKLIKGNVFGPTPRQYAEGKRLIAAKVPAYLIGWKDGQMYMCEWAEQANIKDCYVGGRNFAECLIGCLEATW